MSAPNNDKTAYRRIVRRAPWFVLLSAMLVVGLLLASNYTRFSDTESTAAALLATVGSASALYLVVAWFEARRRLRDQHEQENEEWGT